MEKIIDVTALTDQLKILLWDRSKTREELAELVIGLIEEAGEEVVRKPVVGYEGYYEVDRFGRVFGVDRVIPVDDNGRVYDKPVFGKQMKQSMHEKGYKTVSLTKDGKTKTRYVHRLVAEAFLPNPERLPMVNHKDEDKTNNFLENLEWCTARYNTNYGKGIERHARKIRGIPLSESHKKSIADGVKRYHQKRRDSDG